MLTQEDWNIVLFAGMERTSHWAALYFVALMTFGNYVLFNLLVAILVEGFSNQVEREGLTFLREDVQAKLFFSILSGIFYLDILLLYIKKVYMKKLKSEYIRHGNLTISVIDFAILSF